MKPAQVYLVLVRLELGTADIPARAISFALRRRAVPTSKRIGSIIVWEMQTNCLDVEEVGLTLQHLARMAAGGVGDLGPGEHASDLLNPRATIQAFHIYFGSAADCFLFYEQVAIGKPSDLRLVCHAQNLIRLRQLLELGAEGLADTTPDT